MKRTTRAGWSTAARLIGWRGLLAPALAVVVVLAACGDDSEPSPADATATAQVSASTDLPPTPSIPLEIGAIVWASAVDPDTGAPVDALTSLPNDADAVVAALEAPSLPAGTTIRAQWTIDGDPMPGLEPEPLVVEEPLEGAWLSWRLTWTAEDPWPIGTLGISILIGDEAPITDDIPIVRARA